MSVVIVVVSVRLVSVEFSVGHACFWVWVCEWAEPPNQHPPEMCGDFPSC